MVGRLVEDQQVRRVEGGKPHQQARLLAAGKILGGVSIFSVASPIWATRARTLASGASGISGATCSTGVFVGLEVVQLMLREEADLQVRREP